jgi:pimeloyl-ACP methyl ester carboxylesterase
VPTMMVTGSKVFYEDDPVLTGASSDPFLLVHGFCRSGWFWREWVPVLHGRHRVIRPDLYGCGRSSFAGDPSQLGLEDFVAGVVGLIDGLGIERLNYVGESTGGIVGAVIASQRPELVASLSLVSTPARPMGRAFDRPPGVHSPGATTPEESMRNLGLRQWWLESRRLTGDVFGDERDEEAAAEFAKTPLAVAEAMWRAMHRDEVDIFPYAARIAARTLVLAPGRSMSTSLAEQQRLVEVLPAGSLEVFEDWPHGMYFLHPTELARKVLDFVDSGSQVVPTSG